MKKVYEKPMMSVENFAANEFIAACGDLNKVYNFECNAGYWIDYFGDKHSVPGDVYYDVNGNGKLDRNDEHYKHYKACGKKHQASVENEFIKGIYVPDYNIYPQVSKKEYPVLIWKGENGDNVHCTTNLNINSWETLKS